MFNPMRTTPERQEVVIGEVAKFVVNNGLSSVAEMFLSSLRPTSSVLAGVAFVQYFSFSALFGQLGMEFSYMMADKPEETIDRVLAKIAELDEEQKAASKDTALKSSKPWWKRLLGIN
jgi:hypothetical protein